MPRESVTNGASLRWRLLRRASYRGLRAFSYLLGRVWIRKIEGLNNLSSIVPSIFLCSYTCDYDFLILPALIQRELVFLGPEPIINNKGIVGWILKTNFIVFAKGEYPGYRFFREVIRNLTEYNRSIAFFPDAASCYGKEFEEKYVGIVKLAIKANVPIILIKIEWGKMNNSSLSRCNLEIGKRIYISPNNNEFHDIFFEKGGVTKFSALSKVDLQEIGRRLTLRLLASNI